MLGAITYARSVKTMKIRFRAFIAVAVLLAVAVLVGCGARQGNQADKALGVEAILPLTGPGAPFAAYIKKGLDLAAEEINSNGARAIEVVYDDSKSDPKEAISAFQQKMLTDHPPVTIVALSSVMKALGPLAKPNKTVMVGTAVSLPGVTDPSEYVFRIYPEANGVAGVIAQYAAKKYKTAAVAYIDDDFGASAEKVFKASFEKSGGKVLMAEPYKPRETDFRSQWQRIKEANPQCVWVVGYGPAYSVLIKQMREAQVPSVLLGDMTLGLPITLKNVGRAAEGVVYVDGPMNPDFLAKYQRKYNEVPTSYAGYAYDILKIIKRASDRGQSPDQIRDALAATRDYPGVMGPLTILPNRDAALKFVLMQIKGGKPTRVGD